MRFEIPNLLALGFASPALLGWLALSAVPVLIHWLFRRRYRETSWAAMRFLHEAARKQSRRTRLEQLLLLAARVLVLALIVLALAQPHWANTSQQAGATPPTLRVLVLDCSLSMQRSATQGHKTLFDAAQAAAREIVRQANPGDRFALARVAGMEPRVVIADPTLNIGALLDELARLTPTWERGDVPATMRALPEILRARRDSERAEIVLISDFQAENWSLPASSNAAWEPLAEQAALVLMDVGSAVPQNATILSVSTSPPIVLADQSLSVTVTARNTGSVPLSDRRVDLLIDEQLVATQRVDLPLSQDVSVEFTLAAPPSGHHALAARLEDDALSADNVRWQALRVRSHVGVLLVNGRSAGRPRDSATFFVEQALSPRRRDRSESSDDSASRWLRVETVSEAEWPHRDWSREDVVFLCDVGLLTEAEVERLRQFTSSGGGLILSLGPSVSLPRYNDVVFGPRGLLPIRLLEHVAGGTDEASRIIGFDPTHDAHPLLAAFRGNPGAGLETALIREYVRAAAHRDDESSPLTGTVPESNVPVAAPVEIALKYSTGDPAILTQSHGAGRCVLLTTSVDETWGAWAIWAPGFVPLMHELIDYAAAGRSPSRDRLVGEAAMVAISGAAEPDGVVLTRPNGEPLRLNSSIIHGQPHVTVRETTRPGVYSLTKESPREVLEQFAVNVDPRESDPRRIAAAEFSPTSATSARVIVRDAANPIPSRDNPADDFSTGLARGLLIAVLAFLLIEQCLAWQFSSGVALALLLAATGWTWMLAGWIWSVIVFSGFAVVLAWARSRRATLLGTRAAAR